MRRKHTPDIHEHKSAMHHKRLIYQEVTSIDLCGFPMQAMKRHMAECRLAQASWHEACRILNDIRQR